jgi:hypothetical protein
MAPTPITPVSVGHTALATLPLASAGTAMVAGGDGNSFPNGGTTVLLVFNSGASDHTFEVSFGRTVDGQTIDALGPFTVTAGTERAIKLGPPATYGNPTIVTGNHAELKVRALQL